MRGGPRVSSALVATSAELGGGTWSMGDRQTACLELEPSIRMSKLAGPQEASGQVALSRLEHT